MIDKEKILELRREAVAAFVFVADGRARGAHLSSYEEGVFNALEAVLNDGDTSADDLLASLKETADEGSIVPRYPKWNEAPDEGDF